MSFRSKPKGRAVARTSSGKGLRGEQRLSAMSMHEDAEGNKFARSFGRLRMTS